MLPFELTKDTPYLDLWGELWSVFYEYFNRNWSCYKGFLLYNPLPCPLVPPTNQYGQLEDKLIGPWEICLYEISNFQTPIKHRYLEHFLRNYPQLNATVPRWWLVNIGSVPRKTFMIHQTFVRWALYILFKFVKSLIRHLGQAIRNVSCVQWFSWTLHWFWYWLGGIKQKPLPEPMFDPELWNHFTGG